MNAPEDDAALRFPKLRWPLDLRFERVEQQEVLILRCPLGITPQPLLLVPAVAPIIASFEGQHSVESIAQRFSQHGVTPELVVKLACLLDEKLFLAGPKFWRAERELRETFLRIDTRPPALAGAAYASDAAVLMRDIDRMLAEAVPVIVEPEAELLAVVAPHIDYRRGHACYGTTYAAARGARHDISVLIGTSHQYSERIFHLTRKHFASPLGVISAATDFVDALAQRIGVDEAYRDELLHRQEHSLELQLPLLHRIGFQRPIVPLLVGSFHRFIESGKFPESDGEYERFVESFCAVAQSFIARGSRMCFVAGVDMAHIGRAFGDTQPLSVDGMQRVAERDRLYLEALQSGDRHTLFAHIAEDRDARRICGFPTMYAVLDICQRLGMRYRARVLDYRQAVDYSTDCAVTFAGVALYRTDKRTAL